MKLVSETPESSLLGLLQVVAEVLGDDYREIVADTTYQKDMQTFGFPYFSLVRYMIAHDYLPNDFECMFIKDGYGLDDYKSKFQYMLGHLREQKDRLSGQSIKKKVELVVNNNK